MPDVDSIQRYFPLIQNNTEKLFIASTLDAFAIKVMCQGHDAGRFYQAVLLQGFNDYLKELAFDD